MHPPCGGRAGRAEIDDDFCPHPTRRGLFSMFGKKRGSLTEQDVIDALKGVKDPDLHRDLVDLGMVRNIQIGEGSVALTINLTTPACPLKAQIERDVRTALNDRLGTDLTYHVTMGAEV